MQKIFLNFGIRVRATTTRKNVNTNINRLDTAFDSLIAKCCSDSACIDM